MRTLKLSAFALAFAATTAWAQHAAHHQLVRAADRAAGTPVRAGDMMVMHPGTPHYAWTEGETVVQLHGTGPWGVTYLNPNDDPRKQ